MTIYMRLKNLPVHRAMREISELIYETCKTYLITQGKFLMLLWVVHCRGHRDVFRMAAAVSGKPISTTSSIILGVQHGRESRAATGWRGLAFA